MENEAPISQSLICQKINAAWGISRMSQTGSHLDALIRRLNFYRSRHNGIDFLWLDEAQYRTYSQFRTDSNRAATDLPPEEIANAVKYVLTDSVSLPFRTWPKPVPNYSDSPYGIKHRSIHAKRHSGGSEKKVR